KAAEGEREKRVEQGEQRAIEQTDLGIADAEIAADARREDREDLPVEEAEALARGYQEQGVPACPGNATALARRLFRCRRHWRPFLILLCREAYLPSAARMVSPIGVVG